MSISVDIEKNLGSFHLRVAFEAENETMALLGASGCGKSMTSSASCSSRAASPPA